jgi:hypothetical protein
MKGSEIYAALPDDTDKLPAALLRQVQAGNYIKPQYMPVATTAKGHTAMIWVTTDALHLGEPGDSFRPMVTPLTEAMIAAQLGLYLPTAKLVREVHKQAGIKLEPTQQPAANADRVKNGYSPFMNDKKAMLRASQDIDKKAGFSPGAAQSGTLISNVGKFWINDAKLITQPAMGCNHGWYSKNAPSDSRDFEQMTLWQDRGTRHNAGTDVEKTPGHFDYSQVAGYLVHPKVLVDGGTDGEAWMDFAAVLRDPTLSYLVNDDGPLQNARPHYSGGGTSGVPSVVTEDPSQSGQASSSSVMAYGVVACVALGLFWLTLRK